MAKNLTETIHKHSAAYAEIINLIALAEHHRRTCNDSSCDASLYLCKRTVERLIPYVWQTEKQDIILKITGIRWM